MTRIRRVKVWLNTPARPNRRWIVLGSALVGGVSNVRLARRLDRMEARLAALEGQSVVIKNVPAEVPAAPEVPPRRVSMLACPHGMPNFGPECPVCDSAANQ